MIKTTYKKAFSLDLVVLGHSRVNDHRGMGTWQRAGRQEAWTVSESSHVNITTMKQKGGGWEGKNMN